MSVKVFCDHWGWGLTNVENVDKTLIKNNTILSTIIKFNLIEYKGITLRNIKRSDIIFVGINFRVFCGYGNPRILKLNEF